MRKFMQGSHQKRIGIEVAIHGDLRLAMCCLRSEITQLRFAWLHNFELNRMRDEQVNHHPNKWFREVTFQNSFVSRALGFHNVRIKLRFILILERNLSEVLAILKNTVNLVV